MSDLDLDSIEARAEAAAPGPWWAHENFAMTSIRAPQSNSRGWEAIAQVKHWHGPENAQFIAHARDDVSALVAEVRRLRALLGGAS